MSWWPKLTNRKSGNMLEWLRQNIPADKLTIGTEVEIEALLSSGQGVMGHTYAYKNNQGKVVTVTIEEGWVYSGKRMEHN